MGRLGLVPVLVGLLMGCGGKSNESEGGSGGSGATGGSGGGGGEVSMCQAFDDQAAYQVPVLIINERPEAIHLGVDAVTCDVPPLFQVEDDAGTPLPVPSGCRQSCSLLRVDGAVGCPGICAFPNAMTLGPGDNSTSTFYSGLYQEAAELPRECLPKQRQQEPRACDQARQIQPGTYTFRARAGSSLDCSQTGSACSPCMPSSTGGCATPGALIAGEMFTAEAVVMLDASYGVVPSPRPGVGDQTADQKAAPGDAPIGQVNAVQIIFR